MQNNRLTQLQQFLAEDPQDPFNWYALALEYLLTDSIQARIHFEKLLQDFPHYLPTYYQAAQFYLAIEAYEAARQVFEKGLALSLAQNEVNTHRELQNAYRLFLEELED
ncbi:MAG: hypothetical protein OHK0053_10330 [Microscillaceae bacterium]